MPGVAILRNDPLWVQLPFHVNQGGLSGFTVPQSSWFATFCEKISQNGVLHYEGVDQLSTGGKKTPPPPPPNEVPLKPAKRFPSERRKRVSATDPGPFLGSQRPVLGPATGARPCVCPCWTLPAERRSIGSSSWGTTWRGDLAARRAVRAVGSSPGAVGNENWKNFVFLGNLPQC